MAHSNNAGIENTMGGGLKGCGWWLVDVRQNLNVKKQRPMYEGTQRHHLALQDQV